ncbi:hypothetical protein D0869_09312 [Hortaea werneckii]|uniref:Uncharacterized protein n=1 Tax=Hortaea werneckii TaxID=91943 RepID=A0A3M6ZFJ1_HORWE|nr:hypothetical protein D0869_09312 [Hortaea werneckii]RMY13947.1 hypothetical protein D0868_01727 [Hortaea werneckii]
MPGEDWTRKPRATDAGEGDEGKVGGQENEPWQIPGPVNRTWVEYDPSKPKRSEKGGAQKTVRRHAAAASAAARKQTIAARKEAAMHGGNVGEQGQISSYPSRSKAPQGEVQLVRRTRNKPVRRKRMESASDLLTSLSSESTAYAESPGLGAVQLLDFMRAFQDGKHWYAGPLQGTALAQKAIRTLLWDAYASHPVLFQAALFISGTHSNSCGLPAAAVHHMGSGMLVLRGASLDSIQAAVFASDATDASSTPIAIALLAGWERRYGDPESYAVHMNAWRSLSLPAKALEENNVSTLTEVTLEILRGALDERSFVSPSEIKVASTASASGSSQRRLPPGFKVFNVARPEVRSLFMLIAIVNAFKTDDLSMMPARRKLGLEILAWSPTHTISAGPVPWAEESYDQLELNALYHARAALISINGTIYRKTLDTLKIAMMFQIQTALDVHCVSCQHLNTDALLGTKFEQLAFWSRFTLCAISRDPDRDGYIKRLLHALRLDSWEKVKGILEKHMELRPLFEDKCRAFYDLLMVLPQHEPSWPGRVQVIS